MFRIFRNSGVILKKESGVCLAVKRSGFRTLITQIQSMHGISLDEMCSSGCNDDLK